MPNRILREGILTSERISTLDWEAEVFYRRLMSVVDDYGRYSAHPALLRAALFPLQLDKTRESNMERLLQVLERARLVRLYSAEGKQFLELLDFRQHIRAKESKYPHPPADDTHVQRKCSANGRHLRPYAYSNAQTEAQADSAARAAPALIEHFKVRWEERYAGATYEFSEAGKVGKVGEHFRWLLEKFKGDLERAKATVDAYLADGSQRIVEERHPIAWLVSGFNKYQAPKAGVRTSKVLERTQVYDLP